jgi:hypothetical protein
MTHAVLALTILLGPTFTPDPPPYPQPVLIPTYVTNGDGTRMSCTPGTTYCWQDTTGLPSYLDGH